MKRPEQNLQIAVCRFLDLQYPNLLYAHYPAGGKRSKVEAGIFKAMGVKAGMPDLFFWWSDAVLNHCAAIELKADKGKLNDNQIAMHLKLNAAGVTVAVCRSVEQVQATLEEWGVPKRARMVAGW